MIEGIRSYPEVKDSGLAWLGVIPAQWEIRRNSRLFGPRRETGFPDLPILEVSIRSGVRIREPGDGGRKQQMADRSKYQRAARGDIAYNMMRMWQGAVGIAPADGLVSPAYIVARPFPTTDSAYYAYLFRTAAYMREIEIFSRGIVPDRNRLYWESFKQIPSIYPPLDEQRSIVRFLDWHGAQTVKFIRAKRETISLLSEQKQAIIHRVVTRGLDPNVKLKPSGVSWLGEVPTHWGVRRIKYAFSNIVGGATPASGESSYWNGDVTWITPADVSQTIELRKSQRNITEAGLRSCAATLVPIGTIIVTTRAPVGNVAIARTELATNQGCKALVINSKALTSQFAFYVIALLKAEMQARATGTTFFEISTSRLGEIPIPLPPLSEQTELCASIANTTSELNDAVCLISQEIALVQEFRARLIADVVTGKLDVRAVAATLPEATVFEPTEGSQEVEEFDEPNDSENEEVAA